MTRGSCLGRRRDIGGDAVVIYTDLDLTLIPRQNVSNLDSGPLYHTWSDRPKVLSLPGAQREALSVATEAND